MDTVAQLPGLRIEGDGVKVIMHLACAVRLRQIGSTAEVDGVVIGRETRKGFLIFFSGDAGIIGYGSLFKIYQDEVAAFVKNFQAFGAIAAVVKMPKRPSWDISP